MGLDASQDAVVAMQGGSNRGSDWNHSSWNEQKSVDFQHAIEENNFRT